MTELPDERREGLKAMIDLVLEENLLKCEDAVKIIDICLEACQREKAVAMEDYLKNSLGGEEEC